MFRYHRRGILHCTEKLLVARARNFGIEFGNKKNNHFQTCIRPSVLPVKMHVFVIDTAEIVS